jgi:hypothetical protein
LGKKLAGGISIAEAKGPVGDGADGFGKLIGYINSHRK